MKTENEVLHIGINVNTGTLRMRSKAYNVTKKNFHFIDNLNITPIIVTKTKNFAEIFQD